MGGMLALLDLAWPRRTDRLSLRPATPADLDATWAYRQLPETNRWLTAAPSTRQGYAEHFDNPVRLSKTLVVEHEDRVIGDLMLAVEDAWAQTEVRERAVATQAELGWCLHPGAAGRGFATEAVRALMAACFEDLGVRRVVANCFAANEASWRLMERVGMRRELHTVRDSLHRDGGWMDGLGYALLVEEWRAARG